MKSVVIDIEANSLTRPTKVWLIVCKDIDTGQYEIFREVTQNEDERERFLRFANSVDCWIGHNILGYDCPVLSSLLGFNADVEKCIDTLIISKLVDYPRGRHSIEAYGEEFGLEKIHFNDFTQYSQEMEVYCVRDVDICQKIYLKYRDHISNPDYRRSILLEHRFQLVANSLHNNGFYFNSNKATRLLDKIKTELAILDKDILEAFPPRLKLIRVIEPRRTKYGTLNRSDFRFVKDGDLSQYSGDPFCHCTWNVFNPSSHKQLIDVLHDAGWHPVAKTTAHIEADRTKDLDKLEHLKKYGWKVSEENLATLPKTAPGPALLLTKRILLESRRRTLVEWLGLVQEDGRIHGQYQGIGAWTHRMAHQRPNTANIPNEKDTQGEVKLYGGELRSLWTSPKNRLLLGVDAEGIQLRVFAHYIDDKEFTDALVRGRKEDKTDPHSLNKQILGGVCKHRQAAKRFIYALLLGAGLWKLSQVLECSEAEAREALDRLLGRYTGFATLKRTTIPQDAKRGYSIGLDGRKVVIPGDLGERRHLAMSGYLQNGEAVIMKLATLKWHDKLKEWNSSLVNLVHDEWQTEINSKDMEVALRIAKIQADSLREVGEELNLKCPLAGSYWNDERKDYTIGTNWKVTH